MTETSNKNKFSKKKGLVISDFQNSKFAALSPCLSKDFNNSLSNLFDFQISFYKYKLTPSQDWSRTHGGEGALLRVYDPTSGHYGYSDLHPWPTLGDLNIDELLQFDELTYSSPLFLQSLYLAFIDLEARKKSQSLLNPQIEIKNHLSIVSSDLNQLLQSKEIKTHNVIKIKISPKNIDDQLLILEQLIHKNPYLKLRLDLNSLFTFSEVTHFWNACSPQLQSQIDFIEDPCQWNFENWSDLKKIYNMPIALDREYINFSKDSFEILNSKPLDLPFNFIIYKPAIQNHKFDPILKQLIDFQETHHLKWVVTSYLDHPVGVFHAQHVTQDLIQNKLKQSVVECGLNTLNLYKYDDSLKSALASDVDTGVGLTKYLASLHWTPTSFNFKKLSNFFSEAFLRQITLPINNQYLLLNPKQTVAHQMELKNIIDASAHLFNEPHCWITSSGSSATTDRHLKLIGLSIKSLLYSAVAVNQHLNATSNDVWLNVLPTFHVGGLGIYFRALLTSSKVVQLTFGDWKWNPHEFTEILHTHNITLTSLVPTQIYDLVLNQLQPPSHLRAIVVGGAALDSSLYLKARNLGWPLLPSYGMTEAGSQIATAELSTLAQSIKHFMISCDDIKDHNSTSPSMDANTEQLKFLSDKIKLKVLPHVKISVTPSGQAQITSESICTGYFNVELSLDDENNKCQFSWHPTINQTYLSQDKIELEGSYLNPLGRADEVIKILGENVNLSELRNRLNSIIMELQQSTQFQNNIDYALIAKPDLREGQKLILIYALQTEHQLTPSDREDDGSQLIKIILEKFNSKALPFEKIKSTQFIKNIPKSPLGKILYNQIFGQD